MRTTFMKVMWNFRDYRKDLINNVEKYVRRNNKLICEGNYDDLVMFFFKGKEITDPTMDIECRRFVDPVAYYGDYFFNSPFVRKYKE